VNCVFRICNSNMPNIKLFYMNVFKYAHAANQFASSKIKNVHVANQLACPCFGDSNIYLSFLMQVGLSVVLNAISRFKFVLNQ
jgi:hypothetical protein